MVFRNYTALASSAKLFAIVSIYYEHDCLKKIKYGFPGKGGTKKTFIPFFIEKDPFSMILVENFRMNLLYPPVK